MTISGHMSCQGSGFGAWIVGGGSGGGGSGGNSMGRRPNQVQDVQLSLLCKNSLVRRSPDTIADAPLLWDGGVGHHRESSWEGDAGPT